MQQQLPDILLSSKIKCGIFKQLFNQIIKNIKTDKSFYMYICKHGIQMIFMQSSKQVQIEIFLSNQVFTLQYQFISPAPKTYKFDIRDMQIIGIVFQNTSAIIHLTFKQQQLKIAYENQFSGECIYTIHTLVLERQIDIPKQVGNIAIVKQINQPLKIVSHSLSALSSYKKYQNIEIQFNINTNNINIVPVPNNLISQELILSDINFYIPIKCQKVPEILEPLRFSLRKFKAGLILFDKNQEIRLTFYKMLLKMESASNQRKEKKNIVVLIAAACD